MKIRHVRLDSLDDYFICQSYMLEENVVQFLLEVTPRIPLANVVKWELETMLEGMTDSLKHSPYVVTVINGVKITVKNFPLWEPEKTNTSLVGNQKD